MDKQTFQINYTLLRISTGERLASWLSTKRVPGVELGTTEKKTQIAAGWSILEPGTYRFQTQRTKPRGRLTGETGELNW